MWLTILTLSCVFSSLAQNKTAFVNKHFFSDEKTGIRELVEVNKQLEAEFKQKIDKFNEAQKKFAEYLATCGKSGHCHEIEEKISARDNLDKKFRGNLESEFRKRKSELVFPVNKRIKEKLKEFAKQNNYGKIFDLSESELEDSAFLYTDDSVDVTKEFIKFCNEEFEKDKIQKQ